MASVVKQDPQLQKNRKREVQGTVVSNKMDKTIVVQVQRRVRHSKYEKYITQHTKLYAHDENNECQNGDIVLIEQCRPISRNKVWHLVKIVEKS